MALHWLWKDKCGEATFRQTLGDKSQDFTVSLYQGNAFLIFIYEYEENGQNMYTLYNFFNDEAHAKRCLGLDKNYPEENIFNRGRDRLMKIRLDKSKCTKPQKILDLFIKAFDELDIELYKEA